MLQTPVPASPRPVFTPIRSLGPGHRPRITRHLLALDAHDRYLRFGYPASDEQVLHYVEALDFDRDDVFGIYNRRLELLAMAHLACAQHTTFERCAEFGVTVLHRARGRGYGSRLFERAVMHARNLGVDVLFIHALTENTPMLNIAQNAGAVLEQDGPETDAYLRLPPPNLDTRLSEMVQEKWARTNYSLKAKARALRRWVASWQHRRPPGKPPGAGGG